MHSESSDQDIGKNGNQLSKANFLQHENLLEIK